MCAACVQYVSLHAAQRCESFSHHVGCAGCCAADLKRGSSQHCVYGSRVCVLLIMEQRALAASWLSSVSFRFEPVAISPTGLIACWQVVLMTTSTAQRLLLLCIVRTAQRMEVSCAIFHAPSTARQHAGMPAMHVLHDLIIIITLQCMCCMTCHIFQLKQLSYSCAAWNTATRGRHGISGIYVFLSTLLFTQICCVAWEWEAQLRLLRILSVARLQHVYWSRGNLGTARVDQE
jgi:hypothetical protein